MLTGDWLSRGRQTRLLLLAFTGILAGYLTVWLPNDAAGLSFLGLEIGEWVKFLPRVQAGELPMSRDFFYLPPVILGAMMALLASRWPNSRWQTWAMRGLAILVACLALPSIDAIRFEPASEWLLRLILVASVAILALLSGLLSKLPDLPFWLLMGMAALLGLLLPLWAYVVVRPAVAELWQRPVAFGPGIWLNSAGNLAIILLATLEIYLNRRPH
jgi:hypothetical protein